MSGEVQWFSDAAIAKQRKVEEAVASGERLSITDLFGLWEPRVQPGDEQRCVCCGLDARPDVGGNNRYCGLCLDRGHDEDDEDDDDA